MEFGVLFERMYWGLLKIYECDIGELQMQTVEGSHLIPSGVQLKP